MNAAIILAAGKGTRMGNASINKVAFDCAGVPVIRRIVHNMREGGVSRFVIVVGHCAESVMSALDGEKGVLWRSRRNRREPVTRRNADSRRLRTSGSRARSSSRWATRS